LFLHHQFKHGVREYFLFITSFSLAAFVLTMKVPFISNLTEHIAVISLDK